MVFRDQEDFIDRGQEFYKQWGSYFGRCVIIGGDADNLCLLVKNPASTSTLLPVILKDTPRFTWSIGALYTSSYRTYFYNTSLGI
jgi:hypothetical protein